MNVPVILFWELPNLWFYDGITFKLNYAKKQINKIQKIIFITFWFIWNKDSMQYNYILCISVLASHHILKMGTLMHCYDNFIYQ